MKNSLSIQEAKLKIEHFCAYQERCHEEVISKLWNMKMAQQEIDEIMVHLIEHNFLNEARFACHFAMGKHRIKHWGKIKIANELKIRNINQTIVNKALKEIPIEEYQETFEKLSQRYWGSLSEMDFLKKRKKFCDYMLRKGFESQLVYDKILELETKK